VGSFADDDFTINGDGLIQGDPPAISNVDPADMSTIGRTDFIEFDVTDVDSEIQTVMVTARWSTNDPWEVIFDGDEFSPAYSLFSVRTVITNGYHFKVKRTLGWKSASLTFKVVAVDVTGVEN